MERWVGKVALVTGASVGIGAAISKQLVHHGLKVIGCGRNLDNLQKLASELTGPGLFHEIQCDVSKEDEIVNMFSKIRTEHGRLDVCVNNAGVAHDAPILSGSHDQWRSMLDVNVLGLAICTQEAVKLMNETDVKDGHIFNISSMSGHRIVNDKSGHFYAATKFAVTALTEGTRNELAKSKSKIRITQLSPGVVETEFYYRKCGEQAAKKIHNSFKSLEATDIADAVIYALSAPQHVQIHDMKIRPSEQIS